MEYVIHLLALFIALNFLLKVGLLSTLGNVDGCRRLCLFSRGW